MFVVFSSPDLFAPSSAQSQCQCPSQRHVRIHRGVRQRPKKSPRGVWCGAVAAPCEQTDEGGCFSAPPATNLDARPGQVAASGIGKLRVGSLFGLAAVVLWSPGRREGRNQRGVNCNLGPFSRTRSRRVPVLRLGSRGPGRRREVVALCPQSVRKASAIVRGGWHMLEGPQSPKSSRNAQRSSLLDSFRVFASQKCQQSQGWVVVAKPRTVVTFGLFSGRRVSKVSTVTGIGGVVVAKPRTVVTFGLVSHLRVSKVSTVTGIRGVVVAKPRTVVTFGLFSGRRVSKVSTVTGIGGVVVAKPRTVVTFGLVSGRRETQNRRHFGPASGEKRGEMKKERGEERRGEERGEKRDEKRETKGERREERRETREERREKRGEKREEREEKREERGKESLDLPLTGECNVGGEAPELHEVLADVRWQPPIPASRLGPR